MTGIRKGGGGKTQGKGKRRQPALRVVVEDGKRIAAEGLEAAPCGPEGQTEAAPRRTKMRSPMLPNGLTVKREAFAQAIAGGENFSDAYRKAFDTGNMADSTVWARASELAAEGKVKARIEAILAEKARDSLHDRGRALAWALKNLQKLVEADATSDAARVQAMALVMRHHALLTDKQEVDTYDHRGADELASELRERIERLLAPQPRVA